jgi:hypothetical protein
MNHSELVQCIARMISLQISTRARNWLVVSRLNVAMSPKRVSLGRIVQVCTLCKGYLTDNAQMIDSIMDKQ